MSLGKCFSSAAGHHNSESLNGQFTPLTLSKCVRQGLPTLSLTVGAVWEAGFQQMFMILHDNMRKATDTNQAVNKCLSCFPYIPFLELMMKRTGPVLWHYFHLMCNWRIFFKTKWRHPGEGAI